MKHVLNRGTGAHHRGNPRGFTLMEILLVLMLIALSASLIIPTLGAGLDRIDRKRDLLSLAAAVDTLRDACFSLRVAGRISADDSRIVIRHEAGFTRAFPLSNPGSSGTIRFNALGMTRGGRLRIVLNGVWEINVAPGMGRTSLERGSP